MKKTKKIRIKSRTRIPLQVPETATEHISLKIPPAMKEYLRNQSDRNDLSMTKYIFNIFDSHFAHHIGNEFLSNNISYTIADHSFAEKTKSDEFYWDGMQKVWDFFK